MAKWLEPVPPAEDGEQPSAAKQFLWFIGLSIGGVVTVATVAYGLRKLLLL